MGLTSKQQDFIEKAVSALAHEVHEDRIFIPLREGVIAGRHGRMTDGFNEFMGRDVSQEF